MIRRALAAALLLTAGCHRFARPPSPPRPLSAPETTAGAPSDGAPLDVAPLDVAAAFAAAAYTTTPRLDLATPHVQQVFPGIAGLPPDRRPVRTDVIDERLADPRSAPVVVQVDVQRTWLDGPAPPNGVAAIDPNPHVLLLTMVHEPDGLWLVDDLLVQV